MGAIKNSIGESKVWHLGPGAQLISCLRCRGTSSHKIMSLVHYWSEERYWTLPDEMTFILIILSDPLSLLQIYFVLLLLH